MDKKTILDYVNEAKKDEDKPIANITVNYDEAKKKLYAVVTFKKVLGNRVDFVYDVKHINYLLNCLQLQERIELSKLIGGTPAKLVVGNELETGKEIIVNIDGDEYKTSLDLTNGKFKNLVPTKVRIKPTGTTRTTSAAKPTGTTRTTSTAKPTGTTKKTSKSSTSSKTKTTSKTSSKDSKGVKVRNVSKKLMAYLLGGTIFVITALGLGSLIESFKKGGNEGSEDSKGSDKEIHVQIDDNGQEYETVLNVDNGEEVIVGYQEEAAAEAVDEYIDYDALGYYPGDNYEEPVEYVSDDVYEYRDLGSIVLYDDMETQLNVIDNAAITRAPFQFENLVVADDIDAVYALNTMRNGTFNGNCSDSDYMNALVNYVFKNQNYVNGNFIEDYSSLHPYAQYIIIRMSQGELIKFQGQGFSGYSFDELVDAYDSYGSDLYVLLTQNSKRK